LVVRTTRCGRYRWPGFVKRCLDDPKVEELWIDAPGPVRREFEGRRPQAGIRLQAHPAKATPAVA